MNKFIKLLIISIVFFLSSTSVYAAPTDPPADAGSQKYFCLVAKTAGGHSATLTIDPAKYTSIPGNVYVMVRINSSLSTGDIALDDKIFGNHTGYDALNTSVGFGKNGAVGLVAAQNPLADPSNFPVVWQDNLNPESNSDHYWFGMQIVPPTTAVDSGTAGGLQNGTFNWAASAANTDCVSIKWDPLGYVFDAQTLGVIPGAIVTIYDASQTPPVAVPVGVLKGEVASNPYPTLNNGKFSFFTDAGVYLLTVGGQYNGKNLVIADLSTVNPNYKTAGYINIYKEGSPVIELAGQTVRTDIAVQTVGAPAPILAPPTLSDINRIGGGDKMQISGQVLNYTPGAPNAKVVVVYTDPTTQQSQESPLVIPLGVNGGFNFTTSQTLEGNPTYVVSGLDIKIIGNGTTTRSNSYFDKFLALASSWSDKFFTAHAAANTSSVSIDPIPSYIEGIAKDSRGTVLPSALVGIYLRGSSKPVYQTRSDVNGHYAISSQYIPMLPYEIHYTLATGEVIPLSTTEYIKQNTTFQKQNGINTFGVVKAVSSVDSAGVLSVTKTVISQSPVKSSNQSALNNNAGSSSRSNGTTQVTSSGSQATAGMQGVVMVVVAIFVLLLIGVGAFIMLKSKQQQPQM